MGIRSEITSALSAAFTGELADAVRPFVGIRPAPDAYNPATGGVEAMGPPVTYRGRGVFTGYRAQDIDGTLILSTDLKLKALQAEVAVEPKVGDKINGRTVFRVSQDAAGATWALQLRA